MHPICNMEPVPAPATCEHVGAARAVPPFFALGLLGISTRPRGLAPRRTRGLFKWSLRVEVGGGGGQTRKARQEWGMLARVSASASARRPRSQFISIVLSSPQARPNRPPRHANPHTLARGTGEGAVRCCWVDTSRVTHHSGNVE